jgi:23S rRNA pseudouridine955/2504/2580 synthase
LEILRAERDWLAVNKPPGLPVHEAPGRGSSVLRVLRESHGQAGLAPVHRLDREASGVLLLARNRSAAREFERRWPEVSKTYLAFCEGALRTPRGLIDAPILEHQTGKPRRFTGALRHWRRAHPGRETPPVPPPKSSAVHPAGRPAQTEYRLLRSLRIPGPPGGWCWLAVRPHQGRMHQIRVHLAHAGVPLAVDSLYGRRALLAASDLGLDGAAPLAERLTLHAWRLCLPSMPLTGGRRLLLEAPLPADLKRLWRLCRPARQL